MPRSTRAGLELSAEDLVALTEAAPPRVSYPETFASGMTDARHEDALA